MTRTKVHAETNEVNGRGTGEEAEEEGADWPRDAGSIRLMQNRQQLRTCRQNLQNIRNILDLMIKNIIKSGWVASTLQQGGSRVNAQSD